MEQFTLENSTFQKSTGTALTLINTTARIVSSFFIFNSPGTHKGPFETFVYGDYSFAQVGGAVIVSQSSAIILHTIFEGNYAEYGGAVYSELNSQLIVIDSNFTGNKATAGGGALYAVSGCRVTIIDSNYQNNTAVSVEHDSLGGALVSFESVIFINHSNFSHNMVSHIGGVICTTSNTILNIDNSDFYSNLAIGRDKGGVMFIMQSKVNINGSNFINNTGGVVRAILVSMNAGDNDFTRNSANASEHGGVMWLQMTNATITNCTFTENTADKGGVLEVDGTNLILTRCKFFKNYAFWGGVMRALGGSFVTTTDKIILENNSGHQGIVHFMESTGIISNVKFINNKGSFIAHHSSVTFKEYTSFTNGSQLKTDEIITYQEGGAITGFRSNIFFSRNCIIKHNHAENGGAIYVTQSKLNVLGRVILLNNSATDSGGGIYLYQSELHSLESSTIWFTGNSASQKGGGIHAVSSRIEVNYNVSKRVYTCPIH